MKRHSIVGMVVCPGCSREVNALWASSVGKARAGHGACDRCIKQDAEQVLTDIKGIGPSLMRKVHQADIPTVDALAQFYTKSRSTLPAIEALCTQLGVTVKKFAGFVRQAYALTHEGQEPFLAWAGDQIEARISVVKENGS